MPKTKKGHFILHLKTFYPDVNRIKSMFFCFFGTVN